VLSVPISDKVQDYAIRIVMATQPTTDVASALTKQYLRYGASPRGAQAIVIGAKVRALLAGRSHVIPADVRYVVLPTLRHRVILNFEAEAERIDPDTILKGIMDGIPEPQGNNMELKLSRRESDGVSIIDLSGKITAAIPSPLSETRFAMKSQGNARILINLKDVTYVDSSGLGELVLALAPLHKRFALHAALPCSRMTMANGGLRPMQQRRAPAMGKLKLSNPGRQITDLLHFTKLNSVF